MENRRIIIIGFGSQGKAWAQCLRTSGWEVQILLDRKSGSFQKAQQLGFKVGLLKDKKLLSQQIKPLEKNWVSFLCPDLLIPKVYDTYFSVLSHSLNIILAHGYCVYSGQLHLKHPKHHLTLCAPKAIGPELLKQFQLFYPKHHSLAAGVYFDKQEKNDLLKITRALGFYDKNLIQTTFSQETVADLISEQGLLCGGVFNLLCWTVEAMKAAKIPKSLIREECLQELKLIANLIYEKGPAQAFLGISQAAQCGTIMTRQNMIKSGFKNSFERQVKSILNGRFCKFLNQSKWNKENNQFKKILFKIQKELK